MRFYLPVSLFIVAFFLNGCIESDPAPTCSTKAITYQEFQKHNKTVTPSWTNNNEKTKG